MQITPIGALMRLGETVYARHCAEGFEPPLGREFADTALVLASAGLDRWPSIAARTVEAWPKLEQLDYLNSRSEVIPQCVRDAFADWREGWPEPMAAGGDLVEIELLEAEPSPLDVGLDSSIAPSADEVVASRFNQIETRVEELERSVAHIDSDLGGYEIGLQTVASHLAAHIRRVGGVPPWRSLDEFAETVAQAVEAKGVRLDMLPPPGGLSGDGGEGA